MKDTARNFLTWAPRVAALLFAGFISLFALDSLEGQDKPLEKIYHFLMHLAPTFAVLAALWLAWYRRIAGGLAFMLLGMVFTIYFGTWRETGLFWMLSMPLFATGVLFIFSRYSQLDRGKNEVP